MKKLSIVTVTFLCFLIGTQSMCFAQQKPKQQPTNVQAYCAGALVALAWLAGAPDYDKYNSDKEFCRDSADFYYKWAGYLKWLGEKVTLPQALAKCHRDITNVAYGLADAYNKEDFFTVGLAKVTLAMLAVQWSEEVNKL